MTSIFRPAQTKAAPIPRPAPARKDVKGSEDKTQSQQPQPQPQQAAAAPATAPVQGPGIAPETQPTTKEQAAKDQVLTPEREAEIQQWLDDNATKESSFLFIKDSKGGTTTAEALTGNSSLGDLNDAERQAVAEGAVQQWSQQDDGPRVENMREAAEGVQDDPAARQALASALAAPQLSREEIYAQGGTIASTPEAGMAAMDGLYQALELDPATVINSFDGLEPQLASLTQNDPQMRQQMWETLGDHGRLPAEQTERMATALFMFEDGKGVSTPDARDAFANAIADARRPGDSDADRIARDQMADNIATALQDGDTRDMLFGKDVTPEQRVWALDRIAGDGAACLDDGAMKGGWESEAASRDFAQEVTEAYQGRGTDPQELSGEALRNTVGQAMGIPPDQLPEGELSDEFLAKGLDNTFYSHGGDNQALDDVAGKITELGGDNAQVTVVPVTVTSNKEGAGVVPVFRVETDEGAKFVDHTGRTYSDLADWEENNTLPKGKMTYAEGLDLTSENLTHRNTPGVVDTFAEGFGKVVDGVAIGAGIVAGIALIAGSGGTAAPLVAGAAGLWMAGRAGADLHDMATHGEDISDMSDPAVRGAWLEVAAGVLSVGALGGALKAGSMGTNVSPTLARAVTGMAIAADGADMLAIADQTMQLGQNWDQMSGGERAASMLNIAFWAGMMGASHVASKNAVNGGLADNGFAGINQRIDTANGAMPEVNFPVDTQVAGLGPDEIRVTYDTVNGKAQNIRIQTGGTNPDPVQLALHQRTADQMMRADGLSNQLDTLLPDGTEPPVGSSAWEARHEIAKINEESELLMADAAKATTADEQQSIANRQRELEQALQRETRRLEAAAVDGNGFVAAPRSLEDILTQRADRGEIIRGVPADLPAIEAPKAGDPGQITYLDPVKVVDNGVTKLQAQGIEATLTKDMLDTGSKAKSSIRPPGFEGGANNHSRGHLLARMLGGSGTDEANLVTLFQQNANSPVMSDFEMAVYNAVDAGETINYKVTPIYEEGHLMPSSVAIQAKGDQGFDLSVTIINEDGR